MIPQSLFSCWNIFTNTLLSLFRSNHIICARRNKFCWVTMTCFSSDCSDQLGEKVLKANSFLYLHLTRNVPIYWLYWVYAYGKNDPLAGVTFCIQALSDWCLEKRLYFPRKATDTSIIYHKKCDLKSSDIFVLYDLSITMQGTTISNSSRLDLKVRSRIVKSYGV